MHNQIIRMVFILAVFSVASSAEEIKPHGPRQLQKTNIAETDYPRIVRSSVAMPLNAPLSIPAFTTPIDNRGTDFWVCFEQNFDNIEHEVSLQFFLSSDVHTTAYVNVPCINWSQSYNVMAHEITTIELPSPQSILVNGEGFSDRGIHITADDDITVYGINRMPYSTDAYVALPLDILNIFHIVMSYTSVSDEKNQSQFAIVSPYDNVEVTITPSCVTEGGWRANTSYTITLNKGDVYQVQTFDDLDLTGSVIQSSLPVAVFGGNSCAQVPVGYNYCDHIVEQLPPVNTWGRSFLTVPLEKRAAGDVFRILSSQDNTDIRINGTSVALLNFGDYYETILTQASQVEASNPVLLMQYSVGDEYDPQYDANGDPFMMLIPPTEQFMSNYSFLTPSEGFPQNYLNIVVPQSGIASVLLDDVAITASEFTQIGNSDYYAASLAVSVGSHAISTSNGDRFGIYTYGYYDDDSYGYAGGLSLEYIYAGSGPVVKRTAETIELSQSAQSANLPLTISVDITDAEAPFTQYAMLYYSHTSASDYQPLAMKHDQGERWSAVIPKEAVQDPGLFYYVTASDGQVTGSSPEIDPVNSPHSISVWPNEPPGIVHTPVQFSRPGVDIQIEAQISDNTQYLDKCLLFYRIPGGNPVYEKLTMDQFSGATYAQSIPADAVTDKGVEYYLKAVDNYGVFGEHGSADEPHVIQPAQDLTEYIAEKDQLINSILQIDRPFWGTSQPFYQGAENGAQELVNQAKLDLQNGSLADENAEAIARLVLSERASLTAIEDAIDISYYGKQGLKAITFSKIVGYALKHIGKLVAKVPIIGNLASKTVGKAVTKIESSTTKLLLIFNSGFKSSYQPTLFEWLEADKKTQEAFAYAGEELGLLTIEAFDELTFDGGVFDTADNLIQEFIFLEVMEWGTNEKQKESVHRAREVSFQIGTFANAEADATNTLNSMIAVNSTVKDAEKFADTIREISGWAALIGSVVLVIVGILGAILSGGTSLLASIAGVAAFLFTYGNLVSNTTAIIEAASAAVHVNFVMPYAYINPSVDDAFGPIDDNNALYKTLASDVSSGFETRLRKGDYDFDDPVRNYYRQLKTMIINDEASWATSGIDSLTKYEELFTYKENRIIAELMACADSARNVIDEYSLFLNNYLAKSGAQDIYSAGLLLNAFVYRAGYREQSVKNNSIQILDSLIVNYDKMMEIQEKTYNLIEQSAIPIPNPVGFGDINTRIIPGNSLNQGNVTVEVVNYGSQTVSGLDIWPFVTSENVVWEDSLKNVSLLANETAQLNFSFTTPDSSLIGIMFAKLLNPEEGVYIAPGKQFTVEFQLTSPAVPGFLDNDNVYAYPNPFNPATEEITIRYKLKHDAAVTIKVVDASLQLVTTLLDNEPQQANVEQAIPWDGTNDQGELVANGVYFYIIESSAGERAVGKAAVLR